MNIKDIKEQANLEIHDISKEIQQIQNARLSFPEGYDIQVPPHLIYQIEQYCDNKKIPLYVVHTNCISTAKTYSELLSHENNR